DGTYVFEDYLDNDGIELEERIAIRGAVTVRGSDFLVDFSGTSPQVRGPLNSVPSSTLSAVYYVVRAITDPAIPNNAGCYRPISVTLPTGSILNPEPPAAVNSRTATVKRCVDVLMGALVRAAPERFPAASTGQLLVLSLGGIDPRTGRAYVTSELGGGGLGARPCKDGIDVVDTDVNNCMNIPVEALEMDYPIRILKNNLWADSCGAGRYRGGLGYEKVFQALRGQVVVSHRGERFYTAPWGLCGGRPGRKSRSLVRRRSGATEEIPSKRVFTLDEGETLHVFTAGGGGWGDPLERPPEEVRSDVLDRKVSQTTAREEYGVIIDAEDQSVNVAATEELRRELRQRRGPITWLFDRGEPLGRS
ncbi:MAG: hydantoinase B/oxoprolinase family protein, partial [Nitrospinota bacterium]